MQAEVVWTSRQKNPQPDVNARMPSLPNKHYTLVMIVKGDEILLGMKKRGFGVGKWNGFWGKVKENETIEQCAKKETFEECGLKLKELKTVGTLIFEFVGEPQLLEVHVFRSDFFEGLVTESEEMLPKWFQHDKIPYDSMWVDDILWYPDMLLGKRIDEYILFEGHDKLLHHDLKIM